MNPSSSSPGFSRWDRGDYLGIAATHTGQRASWRFPSAGSRKTVLNLPLFLPLPLPGSRCGIFRKYAGGVSTRTLSDESVFWLDSFTDPRIGGSAGSPTWDDSKTSLARTRSFRVHFRLGFIGLDLIQASAEGQWLGGYTLLGGIQSPTWL